MAVRMVGSRAPRKHARLIITLSDERYDDSALACSILCRALPAFHTLNDTFDVTSVCASRAGRRALAMIVALNNII